jgi:hypothetical protein
MTGAKRDSKGGQREAAPFPHSKQIQISQLIDRNPNFKTQMTIEIQMLKCQNYIFFLFGF